MVYKWDEWEEKIKSQSLIISAKDNEITPFILY